MKQIPETVDSSCNAPSWKMEDLIHDIRTEVGALTAATHFLAVSYLNDEQRNYVDAIQLASSALERLCSGFLDDTNMEKESVYRPDKLLENIAQNGAVRAQQKDISFDLKSHESLSIPRIGKTILLHRIIVNLIDNAIKYTNSGKISISGEILEAKEKDTYLVISVIDTGHGIAEERLGDIFKPYEREISAQSKIGSGLGLNVAHRMAVKCGGTLTVKSRLGQGSTFTLSIPAPLTNEQSPIEFQIGESKEKNAFVFVVDDSHANRVLMSTLLKAAGITATVFKSGLEAITALKDKSPDAILLDIHMKEIDGYQTAEQIRMLGYTGRLIAVTADDLNHKNSQSICINFDAVICKPIHPAELIEAIFSNKASPPKNDDHF